MAGRRVCVLVPIDNDVREDALSRAKIDGRQGLVCSLADSMLSIFPQSSRRLLSYLGLSLHRCWQGRSGDAVTRSDEARTRVALPSICSLKIPLPMTCDWMSKQSSGHLLIARGIQRVIDRGRFHLAPMPTSYNRLRVSRINHGDRNWAMMGM